MTPEERRRAGAAVRERLDDRGLSADAVARAARIDVKTLRRLMRGETWPNITVRARIEKALKWEPGEIWRRGRHTLDSLRGYTERDLLGQLEGLLRELDPYNDGLAKRLRDNHPPDHAS